MASYDDDEPSWVRQLLVTVGALLVVALVIGGVVSVAALGAARVTGLSDSDQARSQPSAEPSLYLPSGEPTTEVEAYPAPSVESGEPSDEATPSPSPSKAEPSRKPPPITLQAFPRRVAPGERITLTGVYQRGEGVELQVQRFEDGAWNDFPVTATVSGRQFSTYITTSRTGDTRLRMVDRDAGRRSNVARVLIQ